MLSKELTYTILPTEGSSAGASKTNYTTLWNQDLLPTDTKLSFSLRERIWICYLALFELPEEAISDIREEMEYKLQYYKELAEYDASQSSTLAPQSVQVKVNKAVTRPLFYLPLNDE